VLEFLISGGARQQETLSISCGEASNDFGSSDGSVDYGDYTGEFTFKDTVKVFRSADRYKAVGVGEFGKDSNVVAVFKSISYAPRKREVG
jgi:hypothetical protein